MNELTLLQDMGFDTKALTASPTQSADSQSAQAAASEEAMTKAQLVLALQRPRDLPMVTLEVNRACSRPGIAQIARYHIKFGGKEQTGPSVHLARVLGQCMGHMNWGSWFAGETHANLIYRTMALDLSTNRKVFADILVPKTIERKNYKTGVTESLPAKPFDIRRNIARETAFGIRNCILELIPRDITEKALQLTDQTLVDYEAGRLEKDRETVVRELIVAFDGLDEPVCREMLEEYLEHKIEAITAQEVARLRAIWKALDDNQSTRDQFFLVAKSPETHEELAAELGIDTTPKPRAEKVVADKDADDPWMLEPEDSNEPKWVTGQQMKVIRASKKSGELTDEMLAMFKSSQGLKQSGKLPYRAAALLVSMIDSGEVNKLGSTLDPGM